MFAYRKYIFSFSLSVLYFSAKVLDVFCAPPGGINRSFRKRDFSNINEFFHGTGIQNQAKSLKHRHIHKQLSTNTETKYGATKHCFDTALRHPARKVYYNPEAARGTRCYKKIFITHRHRNGQRLLTDSRDACRDVA